jgi:hypothetical protein
MTPSTKESRHAIGCSAQGLVEKSINCNSTLSFSVLLYHAYEKFHYFKYIYSLVLKFFRALKIFRTNSKTRTEGDFEKHTVILPDIFEVCVKITYGCV